MSASPCEAGFHETSHGKAGRLVRELEGGAEPAKEAGIAPLPESAGRRGKASAPTATRTGFIEEASAFAKGSGKAARPSGGVAIRKGISTGFGLERFLGRREGFRAPIKVLL
jgi:hypothetical protein